MKAIHLSGAIFVRRIVQSILLAVCLTASVFADTSNPVSLFKLDNGMRVMLVEDHRAPVVTHMVWYEIGAADEDPGKSGLAHMFEHLMFKATDKIEAGEFSKLVARNGGQDNAYTSQDFTVYFQRVAKDRLPKMMELEARRMTHLRLSDEEVLPERDVVKEERRQRVENNPGAILREKVQKVVYGDHPYAIPVIGHMHEVAALSREDALEFYNRWYGPEKAMLVVAGDMTLEELKPLAEEYYGSIEEKGDIPDRALPDVKPLRYSRYVEHRDVKVRQPAFQRVWQGASVSDDVLKDRYALSMALEVLGGGTTSRLYKEIIEKQALAVSAGAYSYSSQRANGMAVIYGTPAAGVELETLEKAMRQVLADFLEHGPTEEEIIRARESAAANNIYGRDSQMALAEAYAEAHLLGEGISAVDDYPKIIRQVTPELAHEAAKKYLTRPDILARLLPEYVE